MSWVVLLADLLTMLAVFAGCSVCFALGAVYGYDRARSGKPFLPRLKTNHGH